MGKTGKERKRRRLLQAVDAPSSLLTTSKPVDKSSGGTLPVIATPTALLHAVVSREAMATTLATLATLEAHPEVFKSQACKPLRAALFNLQESLKTTTPTGKSLTGRISDALTDGRWSDAIADLEEMRTRGQVPTLGALQRWVRNCDAASGKDGEYGDPVVLRTLDSILRTADPSLVAPAKTGELHPIRKHPPWEPFPRNTEDSMELYAASLDGTLFSGEDKLKYKKSFRVVEHTKGPERRTPNKYDFILYHSNPGTITPDTSKPPVRRINVPNVPNAFLLADVLSRSECRQIVAATEAIGYTGDAPLVGIASESVSILAHNFFWLADEQFLTTLFERCKPHFPPVMGGGEVLGLNARFRVYRYVPGAIYRPHIDGAWAGSGLDPVTGKYLYDAYGDRWSRLTFLLYLNDEAEGGTTTFFVPSAQVGFMDAFPVTPRMGAVLCFPHGDIEGSLLHEGSPVLNGAKYVIRTDVLYKVDRQEEVHSNTQV